MRSNSTSTRTTYLKLQVESHTVVFVVFVFKELQCLINVGQNTGQVLHSYVECQNSLFILV